MNLYIGLLRGVNVGGNNKLKMDVLRALCAELGFEDPRTYLQSGNVVFGSAKTDAAGVAHSLERAIEARCGFHSDVVLRTAAEMRAVVERNPFAARADVEPAKLAVSFLAADPGAEAWARVEALKVEPEEMHHTAREMYVYFPNGQGRTKFPFAAVDRALKIPLTARNWNTVTALLAMAA